MPTSIDEINASIQDIEITIQNAQNTALSLELRREYLEQIRQGIGGLKIQINFVNDLDKLIANKKIAGFINQLKELDSQLQSKTSSAGLIQHGLYAQRQQTSLDKLVQAREQLLTAEVDGSDTLKRLVVQREQLKRVKDNLDDVNPELAESSSLLNRMLRQNCSIM